MPKALFLAFANPSSPDAQDRFERWYETHHVPDVLSVSPRLTAATRYSLTDVEVQPGMPKLQHRHLAVYELEAESEADLAEVAQALRDALTSGAVGIDPTLDMETAIGAFLLPAGERHTA